MIHLGRLRSSGSIFTLVGRYYLKVRGIGFKKKLMIGRYYLNVRGIGLKKSDDLWQYL